MKKIGMRALTLTTSLVGLALLPLVTSCGGAMTQQRPEQREEPRQDPAREMDAQEARLEQARQELEQAGPECANRCRAGTSICDAARRICVLADELGDERSHGRCQRAEASCSDATTRVSECHCEPVDTDAGRAKSCE